MTDEKRNDRKPSAPTQPVELSDAELDTVCGGGPHVRVFNGNGSR